MTPKVKLFLIFLALTAIISVFSFFDILGGVRSAKLLGVAKPLLSPEEDVDQDGLSNTDESYWNTDFQNPDTDHDGYLDGEEVVSGFDPRESASDPRGDSLSDTVYGTVKVIQAGDFMDVNLTDNVSGLLAGGIAAGDLTREADEDLRFNALSVLTDSTIEDFYKSLPVIDLDSTKIVESTNENQVKYLNSLAEIIKRDLIDRPQRLDFDQDPFAQNSFFLQSAEHFNLSIQNTLSLTVPKNWLDTHKKILNLLNRFYLSYQAIGDYDKDSIKAVIAFNDLETLNTSTKEILQEVGRKIKANGLQLNDVVFKIMDGVY